MAYKYGDRKQLSLFPASIEDYVGKDSPVRAYDAIINALDLHQLGIEINDNRVGNSAYNPVAMLKLLTYSYSYGFQSSRKIERACYDSLPFIWLTGGLKPDHKTISEFRRKNSKALKKVLKQIVRICIKLNFVDGNVLFVDGSKFRGNASREKQRSEEWCKKKIERLDARIEELLAQCEKQDILEGGEGSYVKMDKELSQKEKLKNKIQHALSELKRKGIDSINITDPDSSTMKGRQGSHSGYNVQSVVDGKEGFIVYTDVVTDKNDLNQIEKQMKEAIKNTGKKCETVCGDAGYANTKQFENIADIGIKVVVPTNRQAAVKKSKPFEKNQFIYDKKKDCYYCPEGHLLKRCGLNKKRKVTNYMIENKQLCFACNNWGKCTTAKRGRSIQRYWNEASTEYFESIYENSQEIYALRKQKVELPFGHIKRNLKCFQFLLRGLKKVQGEMALYATCYNISRIVGKLGVSETIEKIAQVKLGCNTS